MSLPPKVALTAAAALGMYVPTIGLPIPGSCSKTGAVASAAPSPSCSSDLRECLRSAARETIYGARYVPVEEVARCVEAFKSCIHGGAGRGGVLPQHFTITTGTDDLHDCQVSGDMVNCKTSQREPTAAGMFTATGTVTGTVSDSTVTGTWSNQSRSDGADGCVSNGKGTGPVTYTFNPGGTVAMRIGPVQSEFVYTGSCSDTPPFSKTSDAWEGTGTWSPAG